MEDGERQTVQITMSITPDEARDFLERLASDDEFRERLEASPREVLSEYHIVVPQEAIPDPLILPPKEEVESVVAEIDERDELRKAAGYAVLYKALGAMPFVAGAERTGDED
jgi:hypothetical protein